MMKILKSVRKRPEFQFVKNRLIFWSRGVAFNFRYIFIRNQGKYIYVFNHIPKCGGTSLIKLFRSWFCVEMDYPPHDLKFPDPKQHQLQLDKFFLNKPNYLELKPWQLISGHYHMPEFEISSRFPGIFENDKVRVITFIRDPLAHRLSQYYFSIKKGHAYLKGITVEDFLLKSRPNFIADSIGCNVTNFKRRIDKYFFIGDMDNFDGSIKALSSLIGRDLPLVIPHVNQTTKLKSIDDLDDQVILKFQELNKLDYLVVKYAKERANHFIFQYSGI